MPFSFGYPADKARWADEGSPTPQLVAQIVAVYAALQPARGRGLRWKFKNQRGVDTIVGVRPSPQAARGMG